MKRSWFFLFVAVLLMGCGGGSDSKTAATGDSGSSGDNDRMNLVLAEVAGKKIYGSDVRYHMERTTGPATLDTYLQNPDIVGVALAALVDQYVWAEMARRDGYKLTDEEQRKLYALETEFLATRYVADVVAPKAEPTPEEVETFYLEHQDKYLAPARVAVRHILVDTEQEARDLLQRAIQGEDFATLAKTYSKDPVTRDLGGALGYVYRGADILSIGKSSVFEDAVQPLDPGEMNVVHTHQGWHVVKVEEKEGGGVRPFEEVRDEIRDLITRREIGLVLNTELESARDETNTRIFGEVFGQFTGQAQNCERLMQMAAEHPEAEGRAELYRRVAFEFSDCDQAPKAQFMIGYVRFKEMENPLLARKALQRLERQFPDSDWTKAGRYLMGRLDGDPSELGTPDEILAQAMSEDN